MERGRPLQILRPKDDGTFEMDKEALRGILLSPHVRDKPVAIVSVAGAFRKGKSFLLGFFLRYMRSADKDNWLGDVDAPLSGFKGRGGCDGDTKGIWVWSEAFLVETPHGEQIAVLLMDTQGTFDCESTTKDCATIFALSTMISSVQVYNLSQNIQEDDLQYLQYFADYGQIALKASICSIASIFDAAAAKCWSVFSLRFATLSQEQQVTPAKPFQKLLFLVRDWSYPYDLNYGAQGGKLLLQKRLDITPKMPKQLRTLRQHIRFCFSDIDCFLLPHPGEKVATEKYFDGRLSGIAETFKQHLKELVPSILAPDKLIVKVIHGKKVSCKQLLEYFKAYVDIFSSGVLPPPMFTLEASARVCNHHAKKEAKKLYKSAMEKHCNLGGRWWDPRKLQEYHDQQKQSALKLFLKSTKWGGRFYSNVCQQELNDEIDKSFNRFVECNDGKARIRTTVMLSGMATLSIISMAGLGGVGLVGGAVACLGMAGASTAAAAVRNNVPSRGHWRKIFTFMDTPVNYVWDSIAHLRRGGRAPDLDVKATDDEEKQPHSAKPKGSKND
ncbi:atlastin-2-like isoform X3 [Haemaphysalis longicornis]